MIWKTALYYPPEQRIKLWNSKLKNCENEIKSQIEKVEKLKVIEKNRKILKKSKKSKIARIRKIVNGEIHYEDIQSILKDIEKNKEQLKIYSFNIEKDEKLIN